MTFDALTVAAVRDEIQAQLLGGRVERVVLPAQLAVGLEVYAHGTKRWLFASAHPQQASVYLTSERLARASDDVSPLLLLLRKYVRDGRLVAVEQPPWERVLALRFEKHDDEGLLRSSSLIIEIMGRHSNIVLVGEDGRVLDSAKRVGPALSRYRTVMPNQPYTPPPPPDRPSPAAVAEGQLAHLCARAGPQAALWQALVGALAGVSPLLAREIAFRATGNTATLLADVSWPAVEGVLRQIVADVAGHHWTPCLGLLSGEPAAFAAYELHQFADRRLVGSISEAVEAFNARLPAPTRAGETGKAALREMIASLRERALRRQRSLKETLPAREKVERLRRQGELLLAYGHGLPAGARTLVADGEVIEVDPTLSAADNAQRYFREYQKAKAGLAEVPALLEQVERELGFLDQVATDLELASTPAELAEVRQELSAAGLLKVEGPAKQKGREKSLPLGRPIISADGFEILIGRSARQNERITFDLGAGGDVWLHARGVPGAHVLVKSRGREVPERTLREAAAYAAYFSQARGAANVAVDCTLQRHVRRLKGAPPGMVTYEGERTLHVRPAAPPEMGRPERK